MELIRAKQDKIGLSRIKHGQKALNRAKLGFSRPFRAEPGQNNRMWTNWAKLEQPGQSEVKQSKLAQIQTNGAKLGQTS